VVRVQSAIRRQDNSYIAGGTVGVGIIGAILFGTGFLPLHLDLPFLSDVKIERTESIVLGIINVAADSYEYEQFMVPYDATDAIARGSFFVSGGDEIHIMILDQDDFDSWKDGAVPATI
jgi:hypothetical protein